ncbi:MAG: right-handed parallel beta-helix repeat-containing protein [Desulfobacterales bacterium]|nr:right-handed parallel beta-helix repeat-containing protein [Desulfobacterales bacterium]
MYFVKQDPVVAGIIAITIQVVCVLAAATAALGFEIPRIIDTDYPIPSGSFFVATDGDNANQGTESKPFLTIGHALGEVPDGSTIVVREGVYREGGYVFNKKLTLQPYPHEEVWMKGSIVLSDWVAFGAIWRHDGWTYQFDQDSYAPGTFEEAYPHAGKPDMVFVDGEPLQQVGELAEVTGNSFFVDYQESILYIGTDPQGKTIEASAWGGALRALQGSKLSADGSIIRGLGLMHYAGDHYEGSLQCDEVGVTFENNTIAWSASNGLAIYNSTGSVVRGNTIIYNGHIGLSGFKAQDLVVEDNRFIANNQEHFVTHGPAAEAAGVKIFESNGLLIRNNLVKKNLAIGMWFDGSTYDARIVSNVARDNESIGFYYEISTDAVIAGNLAVGNDEAGIELDNATRVKVYNNTLAGNTLAVFDDQRENTDPSEREKAHNITWITGEVELKNNIISNSDGKEALLIVRDFNSQPLKGADDMITASNHNAYYRTNSSIPSTLVEWWRGTNRIDFLHLDAFRSGTSEEANGQAIDDVAESPFFVDEPEGDYRLRGDSIARRAGEPLPPDVADALGLKTGVPVDVGAFQFSSLNTIPLILYVLLIMSRPSIPEDSD